MKDSKHNILLYKNKRFIFYYKIVTYTKKVQYTQRGREDDGSKTVCREREG